jgi:hypothetical protein
MSSNNSGVSESVSSELFVLNELFENSRLRSACLGDDKVSGLLFDLSDISPEDTFL